ncbi:MAG: M20/M25/M40 family metallo-hydrolase [Romboutsia sp.]|nr:M20/M25/M40 family metallo-hydrolase [Romboutsia sp.]
MVDCNTAKESDLKDKNLNGKIALIKRGDITFNEKVRNVSKEGAKGIILYNNDSGVVIPGLDINKDYAPAVCITEEDGNILLEKINTVKKLSVCLEVNKSDEVTSWNVIATKKSNKNNSDIVYVSAHIDNAILSLGANDNASGVSAMLEIARNLKDVKIDKEIRFLACGSEEVGLLGSQEYVKSLSKDEIDRSIANFNLDMVATNYEACSELGVYTSNGEENIVTDYIKKAGDKLEYLSNETTDYNGDFDGKEGSSDHQSFHNVGIPSALLINIDPSKRDNSQSNVEPYYHKPEDNISNISRDRLERTIKLGGIAILNIITDK